jgi:hypothetical protein
MPVAVSRTCTHLHALVECPSPLPLLQCRGYLCHATCRDTGACTASTSSTRCPSKLTLTLALTPGGGGARARTRGISTRSKCCVKRLERDVGATPLRLAPRQALRPHTQSFRRATCDFLLASPSLLHLRANNHYPVSSPPRDCLDYSKRARQLQLHVTSLLPLS